MPAVREPIKRNLAQTEGAFAPWGSLTPESESELRQRIKSAALEVAREKNLGEQDKNRFVCAAVAQWEPIPEEMEESV